MVYTMGRHSSFGGYGLVGIPLTSHSRHVDGVGIESDSPGRSHNQTVHEINTRMVTELHACRQRTYDYIGNFLACISKVEATNVISFKTLSKWDGHK